MLIFLDLARTPLCFYPGLAPIASSFVHKPASFKTSAATRPIFPQPHDLRAGVMYSAYGAPALTPSAAPLFTPHSGSLLSPFFIAAAPVPATPAAAAAPMASAASAPAFPAPWHASAHVPLPALSTLAAAGVVSSAGNNAATHYNSHAHTSAGGVNNVSTVASAAASDVAGLNWAPIPHPDAPVVAIVPQFAVMRDTTARVNAAASSANDITTASTAVADSALLPAADFASTGERGYGVFGGVSAVNPVENALKSLTKAVFITTAVLPSTPFAATSSTDGNSNSTATASAVSATLPILAEARVSHTLIHTTDPYNAASEQGSYATANGAIRTTTTVLPLAGACSLLAFKPTAPVPTSNALSGATTNASSSSSNNNSSIGGNHCSRPEGSAAASPSLATLTSPSPALSLAPAVPTESVFALAAGAAVSLWQATGLPTTASAAASAAAAAAAAASAASASASAVAVKDACAATCSVECFSTVPLPMLPQPQVTLAPLSKRSATGAKHSHSGRSDGEDGDESGSDCDAVAVDCDCVGSNSVDTHADHEHSEDSEYDDDDDDDDYYDDDANNNNKTVGANNSDAAATASDAATASGGGAAAAAKTLPPRAARTIARRALVPVGWHPAYARRSNANTDSADARSDGCASNKPAVTVATAPLTVTHVSWSELCPDTLVVTAVQQVRTVISATGSASTASHRHGSIDGSASNNMKHSKGRVLPWRTLALLAPYVLLLDTRRGVWRAAIPLPQLLSPLRCGDTASDATTAQPNFAPLSLFARFNHQSPDSLYIAAGERLFALSPALLSAKLHAAHSHARTSAVSAAAANAASGTVSDVHCGSSSSSEGGCSCAGVSCERAFCDSASEAPYCYDPFVVASIARGNLSGVVPFPLKSAEVSVSFPAAAAASAQNSYTDLANATASQQATVNSITQPATSAAVVEPQLRVPLFPLAATTISAVELSALDANTVVITPSSSSFNSQSHSAVTAGGFVNGRALAHAATPRPTTIAAGESVFAAVAAEVATPPKVAHQLAAAAAAIVLATATGYYPGGGASARGGLTSSRGGLTTHQGGYYVVGSAAALALTPFLSNSHTYSSSDGVSRHSAKQHRHATATSNGHRNRPRAPLPLARALRCPWLSPDFFGTLSARQAPTAAAHDTAALARWWLRTVLGAFFGPADAATAHYRDAHAVALALAPALPAAAGSSSTSNSSNTRNSANTDNVCASAESTGSDAATTSDSRSKDDSSPDNTSAENNANAARKSEAAAIMAAEPPRLSQLLARAAAVFLTSCAHLTALSASSSSAGASNALSSNADSEVSPVGAAPPRFAGLPRAVARASAACAAAAAVIASFGVPQSVLEALVFTSAAAGAAATAAASGVVPANIALAAAEAEVAATNAFEAALARRLAVSLEPARTALMAHLSSPTVTAAVPASASAPFAPGVPYTALPAATATALSSVPMSVLRALAGAAAAVRATPGVSDRETLACGLCVGTCAGCAVPTVASHFVAAGGANAVVAAGAAVSRPVLRRPMHSPPALIWSVTRQTHHAQHAESAVAVLPALSAWLWRSANGETKAVVAIPALTLCKGVLTVTHSPVMKIPLTVLNINFTPLSDAIPLHAGAYPRPYPSVNNYPVVNSNAGARGVPPSSNTLSVPHYYKPQQYGGTSNPSPNYSHSQSLAQSVTAPVLLPAAALHSLLTLPRELAPSATFHQIPQITCNATAFYSFLLGVPVANSASSGIAKRPQHPPLIVVAHPDSPQLLLLPPATATHLDTRSNARRHRGGARNHGHTASATGTAATLPASSLLGLALTRLWGASLPHGALTSTVFPTNNANSNVRNASSTALALTVTAAGSAALSRLPLLRARPQIPRNSGVPFAPMSPTACGGNCGAAFLARVITVTQRITAALAATVPVPASAVSAAGALAGMLPLSHLRMRLESVYPDVSSAIVQFYTASVPDTLLSTSGTGYAAGAGAGAGSGSGATASAKAGAATHHRTLLRLLIHCPSSHPLAPPQLTPMPYTAFPATAVANERATNENTAETPQPVVRSPPPLHYAIADLAVRSCARLAPTAAAAAAAPAGDADGSDDQGGLTDVIAAVTAPDTVLMYSTVDGALTTAAAAAVSGGMTAAPSAAAAAALAGPRGVTFATVSANEPRNALAASLLAAAAMVQTALAFADVSAALVPSALELSSDSSRVDVQSSERGQTQKQKQHPLAPAAAMLVDTPFEPSQRRRSLLRLPAPLRPRALSLIMTICSRSAVFAAQQQQQQEQQQQSHATAAEANSAASYAAPSVVYPIAHWPWDAVSALSHSIPALLAPSRRYETLSTALESFRALYASVVGVEWLPRASSAALALAVLNPPAAAAAAAASAADDDAAAAGLPLPSTLTAAAAGSGGDAHGSGASHHHGASVRHGRPRTHAAYTAAAAAAAPGRRSRRPSATGSGHGTPQHGPRASPADPPGTDGNSTAPGSAAAAAARATPRPGWTPPRPAPALATKKATARTRVAGPCRSYGRSRVAPGSCAARQRRAPACAATASARRRGPAAPLRPRLRARWLPAATALTPFVPC